MELLTKQGIQTRIMLFDANGRAAPRSKAREKQIYDAFDLGEIDKAESHARRKAEVDRRSAMPSSRFMQEDASMGENQFVVDYVAARGGKDSLSEEEKIALVAIARRTTPS